MYRFLLLATLLGAEIASAELRIPAATAYLEPEKADLRAWREPGVTVSWFGEMKSTGELDCSIATSSEHARLRLTVAGEKREAEVKGGVARFGKVAIGQAGYVRFTLEALEAKAGDLEALVLDGPALSGAHFNLLPRRNAASVHLNYTLPKGAELDAFYAEGQAVEDPIHTFYMVCGFQRGYFGMQVNSASERRIIFSVWDSGAGKTAMKRDGVEANDQTALLAKGEGVVASAFGGEGTGGHSHLVYPWKTGEPQRFLLTSRAAEGESAIFSGYWFHPERQAWMLIASFRAPKASAALGHFHSFSENFVGSNGQLRRRALFGNQWVHAKGGSWSEVREASFSHDATGKEARLDRMMGVENGWFFLAHGGFVEGTINFGDKYTRPSRATPPAVDLEHLPPS